LSRRAVVLGLGATFGAILGAAPAAAQLDALLSGRTAVGGNRAGVDEALRRTVTLVLRAEARRAPLPPAFTNPQPLTPQQAALLVKGATLPRDFPAIPATEAMNRRLPHARGGSVWVVAGSAMLEIDPTRLRVLSVAHDVLPPDLYPDQDPAG
jgi:hypothetical protein